MHRSAIGVRVCEVCPDRHRHRRDSNSAAYQGVVAITPRTATTPLRGLGYICTTAGNINLTLADSSTITLPIQTASGQSRPFRSA